MKNAKPVKRLTEVHIYWILFISLAVCIPLLVCIIKSSTSERDAWINENNNDIQELSAIVTQSIRHGGRSPYYEISLTVSDGAHLVYKLEKNISGTVPFYSINIDGETYYAFNRETLYWEVYKVKDIIYMIIIGLLCFTPVLLFLYLREKYGYGIRRKQRSNQFNIG